MSDLVIIGNYVEFPSESEICRHVNNDMIMFLGKMDYEPNVTAVTHFTKSIFPKLKKKHPNLKFIIVGAKPLPSILELNSMKGVEVTGFVESTSPYFRNSTIVVAPMLSGSGIQNKIIQAMSFGCCVATTTIGAEGLTIYGNDLNVFNSDNEWVLGLDELLNNRQKRIFYGQNARETVRKTLTKDVIYNQFQQLIEKVTP